MQFVWKSILFQENPFKTAVCETTAISFRSHISWQLNMLKEFALVNPSYGRRRQVSIRKIRLRGYRIRLREHIWWDYILQDIPADLGNWNALSSVVPYTFYPRSSQQTPHTSPVWGILWFPSGFMPQDMVLIALYIMSYSYRLSCITRPFVPCLLYRCNW